MYNREFFFPQVCIFEKFKEDVDVQKGVLKFGDEFVVEWMRLPYGEIDHMAVNLDANSYHCLSFNDVCCVVMSL